MSTITSSNRSRAEWADYIEVPEPRTSVAKFMSDPPHSPACELIAQAAIVPDHRFDHVIAIDECGAPILGPDAIDVCENV